MYIVKIFFWLIMIIMTFIGTIFMIYLNNDLGISFLITIPIFILLWTVLLNCHNFCIINGKSWNLNPKDILKLFSKRKKIKVRDVLTEQNKLLVFIFTMVNFNLVNN